MFGPTIDDIDQGNTGDCYVIAALGAVAQANPHRVRKIVRRNTNGTYGVTFHERGSWPPRPRRSSSRCCPSQPAA